MLKPMTTVDDDGSPTIGEARASYFAANGLGDGGYDAKWVKLMAGPIPIFLPNTKQRVRSVRLHDIHHLVTGYATSWTGEAEISAWEIASSCVDHWAAWALNLSGMAIGLAIAPPRIYHAFVRGRHSANLYAGEYDDSLLATGVAELRARLALDRPAPLATARDRLAFAAWSAVSIAVAAAPWIVAAGAILALAR